MRLSGRTIARLIVALELAVLGLLLVLWRAPGADGSGSDRPPVTTTVMGATSVVPPVPPATEVPPATDDPAAADPSAAADPPATEARPPDPGTESGAATPAPGDSPVEVATVTPPVDRGEPAKRPRKPKNG
jgi:hypothetical protein